MSTDNQEHELLTVSEVASELRISSPTARRWIADGTLPVAQPGGPGHAIRIKRTDLDRLLEAQSRSAA